MYWYTEFNINFPDFARHSIYFWSDTEPLSNLKVKPETLAAFSRWLFSLLNIDLNSKKSNKIGVTIQYGRCLKKTPSSSCPRTPLRLETLYFQFGTGNQCWKSCQLRRHRRASAQAAQRHRRHVLLLAPGPPLPAAGGVRVDPRSSRWKLRCSLLSDQNDQYTRIRVIGNRRNLIGICD